MADSEVSALTEQTSPALTDLLYLTNAGGTIDRKLVLSVLRTLMQPLNGTASVATSETTTSLSYTDLTTPGPAVTLDTGTKALVLVSANIDVSAGAPGAAILGVAVSGATTVAAAQVIGVEGVASGEIHYVAGMKLITGLTAGSNTFTCKYAAGSGDTARFSDRRIAVFNMGS